MTVINSDYSWLTWGVSDVPHGRLSPEVLAAFAADRERARSLPVVVQAVPSGWSYDSSLRRHSAGDRTRLRAAWRRVTSFTADRCQIYLEAFGGIGGGPGFGFRDVRIYVDGRLTGRAWKGGCSLGFGGGAGPAVAMLRDDLAIRVTLPLGADRDWETVDLVGFADSQWTEDFVSHLPAPRGLNSRGRRTLRCRG